MSIERGAENTQGPKQKLAKLNEYSVSPVDPHIAEFARLLSDRLNPELVPIGFIMASTLLIYDLEQGTNGFTGKAIESSLVQQSPDLYETLTSRLPELAAIAFTPQFAKEVRKIMEEDIKGKKISSTKPIEKIAFDKALDSLSRHTVDPHMKIIAENDILPEVTLTGLDPVEIIKRTGTLPKEGILLQANITRGGNSTFHIYEYKRISDIKLSEQGENNEYQYITASFPYNPDSRVLRVGYEHPDYSEKRTQPYARTSDYSHIGSSFDELDKVPLTDGGRMLISKEPFIIGNLHTRFDQHGWKIGPLNDPYRHILRWLSPSDIDTVGEVVEMITRDLMGVDSDSASKIKQTVENKLAPKTE